MAAHLLHPSQNRVMTRKHHVLSGEHRLETPQNRLEK